MSYDEIFFAFYAAVVMLLLATIITIPIKAIIWMLRNIKGRHDDAK